MIGFFVYAPEGLQGGSRCFDSRLHSDLSLSAFDVSIGRCCQRNGHKTHFQAVKTSVPGVDYNWRHKFLVPVANEMAGAGGCGGCGGGGASAEKMPAGGGTPPEEMSAADRLRHDELVARQLEAAEARRGAEEIARMAADEREARQLQACYDAEEGRQAAPAPAPRVLRSAAAPEACACGACVVCGTPLDDGGRDLYCEQCNCGPFHDRCALPISGSKPRCPRCAQLGVSRVAGAAAAHVAGPLKRVDLAGAPKAGRKMTQKQHRATRQPGRMEEDAAGRAEKKPRAERPSVSMRVDATGRAAQKARAVELDEDARGSAVAASEAAMAANTATSSVGVSHHSSADHPAGGSRASESKCGDAEEEAQTCARKAHDRLTLNTAAPE